ncbi:hypothetical protein SAY86_022168 [Trapa natans]|uniref:Methyltransferase type 11 domain-containing protein n=1 Tax=Trapa natans TaxID=22666 RepID=A0AAN7MWJ8_TRANT|nr:hypothetical protein SAY86_022168 [Trapa natans]
MTSLTLIATNPIRDSSLLDVEDRDIVRGQEENKQAFLSSWFKKAGRKINPSFTSYPSQLMLVNFLRVKRIFVHGKESFPSSLIYRSFHLRLFSSMKKDIQGNVLYGLRTSESVAEHEEEKCSTANAQSTPEIEKKYVHRVYDAIAPHFSSTRFAKWPKVAAFLGSLPLGSLVLDAGCGNGKYLGLNPDCYFIGCDISAPLIKICSDREHEVLVADAVNLPYRTGFGDAAISIAVLHHLSTESRRKKAIQELVRVVKVGGLVLITVWAAEQEDKTLVTKWTPLADKYAEEWVGPSSPRARSSPSLTLESIPEAEDKGFKEKEINLPEDSKVLPEMSPSRQREINIDNQQEYFVPWHLPYHRAEVGGASAYAVESGLAKKDDKKGAVVYNRYYHVFCEGELERLVSGMNNVTVVDRFFDKSNWCIVIEKSC